MADTVDEFSSFVATRQLQLGVIAARWTTLGPGFAPRGGHSAGGTGGGGCSSDPRSLLLVAQRDDVPISSDAVATPLHAPSAAGPLLRHGAKGPQRPLTRVGAVLRAGVGRIYRPESCGGGWRGAVGE